MVSLMIAFMLFVTIKQEPLFILEEFAEFFS